MLLHYQYLDSVKTIQHVLIVLQYMAGPMIKTKQIDQDMQFWITKTNDATILKI